MGRKKDAAKAELSRLEAKTLDGRFMAIITEGLNCSQFEAERIVEVVHEVYLPYVDSQAAISPPGPPGRMSVVVVDAEEPAGKPLEACAKQSVSLGVHRGAEDDGLMQQQGVAAFRRARIADLCQEALSQGGLLTREDLAYRIFFVSPRTISRDLAWLRTHEPGQVAPLRSMVQDIGPMLTHRVQIVRLALEGKTATEIRVAMHHSLAAISNYLSTFIRCAQLRERGIDPSQIAFLIRRSRGLVDQYLALLNECKADKNLTYHLNQMLELGVSPKKTTHRTVRRGLS